MKERERERSREEKKVDLNLASNLSRTSPGFLSFQGNRFLLFFLKHSNFCSPPLSSFLSSLLFCSNSLPSGRRGGEGDGEQRRGKGERERKEEIKPRKRSRGPRNSCTFLVVTVLLSTFSHKLFMYTYSWSGSKK